MSQCELSVKILQISNFYLPPGSPEGDYNLHHVRVYVRACVCHACLCMGELPAPPAPHFVFLITL